MNYANILIEMLAMNIWPLSFILLGLFVMRQLRQDVQPVFVSIVSGVAKNAQSNAVAYAIAIGFGLSASLSAFVEVFRTMGMDEFKSISWHQYLVLWCKVLNPFIVAILAYATQNKFKTGPLSETTPPFPIAPQPPTP